MKLASLYENHKVFCVLLILIIPIIIITYGLMPNYYLISLGGTLLTIGSGESIVRSGLFSYPMHTGFPIGTPIVFGLPLNLIQATFIFFFNLSATTAFIITVTLFIGIACIGCYLLLKSLGIPPVIALLFTFVFITLPFLWGHGGYGALPISFTLLPLLILIDKLFFEHISKTSSLLKFRTLGFVLGYILMRSFILFMEGYTFIMWCSISGAMLITYSLPLLQKRRFGRVLFGTLTLALAASIAYISYGLYIPGGTSYAVMPADFFRGQGIDLTTLLLPYKNSTLFTSMFELGSAYSNPLDYWSDGSNIRWNFLGIIIPICAIGFLLTRKSFSRFGLALLIVGIVSFFLSLGPSLKINALRPEPIIGRGILYNDYLMPAEAATIHWGIDNFFTDIPGLNIMRATYRWILIPKIMLIIGAALFITNLIKKGHRKTAFILLTLIIIEAIPPINILHTRYQNNENQRQQIDRDIINNLENYIQPNELIVFITRDNDFLANYISPHINAYAYNVGGDKNILISRPYYPETITNILALQDVAENTYLALQSGEIDWLIIPYFNLRLNSYFWPPTAQQMDELHTLASSLFDTNDERFEYIYEQYFTLVRLAQ